jgi:hypothetical protein
MSSSCVLCMVVSNTYCVVFFALLVFVLCLVYGGVQHILCCALCFVCLRLVSCVWWCPTHIVLYFLFCLSSSCVLCIVVSNKYCVVCFALYVFVLCLVYGGIQHILCCVLCFVCLPLVSCVWWCPTHIVLCFMFCLSSSCVLCMVVSNAYCGVFYVLLVFVLCLVYGGVQRILCCVLCFVGLRLVSCVWWCPTHIVVCFMVCLSSSCVLCIVVYNTYCVVFFVLFVFILCIGNSGVQHILCCVLCFVCLRLVSCA